MRASEVGERLVQFEDLLSGDLGKGFCGFFVEVELHRSLEFWVFSVTALVKSDGFCRSCLKKKLQPLVPAIRAYV